MTDLAAAPRPWASHAVAGLARRVPFALAGVAPVGLVLDEIDVPHDDLPSIAILGAGVVAGLLASLGVARWATTDDRAARAREAAWDVVRFFLAFEMMRYGMAKVVGMQFYPQYWRLDQRPLDMHPMSLAWVFFGRTTGYPLVAGLVEVASGVLVCFRRTTLLGACVMATALANVVLVNFFYDVPVKLFASLYLAMDVCLIAREGPRLWAFFLAPVRGEATRFGVLRAVVIVLALALPTAEILHDAARYDVFHVDALEGVWRVDQRSGLDDLLPDAAGSWDGVYFEKGHVGFVRVGKRRVRFEMSVDAPGHAMRLTAFDGPPSPPLEGTFELHERELHFAGSRDGHAFSMDLTREFPR
jgi:uncharacterized membrane protein YphA (DoxX/SURF4 family)